MNGNKKGAEGMFRTLIALCVLLPLAVAGCSKSPEKLLGDAKASVEAKEHLTAIVTLKNLLQVEPDNIEARLLLAETSLAMADPLSAEKELEKAAELGETGAQFLDLHYRTQLMLGRSARVLELLSSEENTTGLTPKQLLQFRGEALLNLGSAIEAEQAFARILETGSDPEALWGLAAAKAARGWGDEIGGIAEQLTDQYPDYARGWLIKGQMALRRGMLDDAIQDLGMAVDKAAATPDRMVEIVSLSALGDAQLGLRDVEAADVTIKRLASLSGPTPSTRMLVARLAIAKQDLTGAAGELDQLLAYDPNHVSAMVLRSSVHVQQKNYAQAKALLERLLAMQPQNLAARRLLAVAQMELNDPAAATETLTPLLELEDRDSELSVFASQTLLEAGDPDRAIEVLEESLARDPANDEIKLRLAAAYLAADRAEDAEAMIATVPEDAGIQRGIILAFAYAAQDRFEEADQAADSLVDSNEGDPAALVLAADYYGRRGDTERNIELLRRAVAVGPNDTVALHALARAELTAGNLVEAAELFEKILVENPDHIESLTALADLSARRNELERSLELLQRATSIAPGNSYARLMLAQAQLRTGNIIAAEESAHEAADMADDNAQVIAAAAVVLLDTGKTREAQRYLSRAVELDPDVASYWYGLARAQTDLGNRVEARRALENAVRLRPNSVQAAASLALVELQDGNEDAAFEIVQRLKDANPDSLAPLSLEASLMMRVGRYDEAVKVFRYVHEQQPSTASTIDLYRASVRAEVEEPQLALEKWVRENPADGTAAMFLAQYYESAGAREQSVDFYRQAIAANPDNALALNNLAFIYGESGDERAEGLARRAYELLPNSPGIMDTLGWILLNNGETTEAYQLLERAASLNPESRNTQYHLAVASSKLGDPSRSLRILRAILADDTEFAERDEAAAFLEELE